MLLYKALLYLPALQLVDLCKGKDLVDDFALAVDEHLGEFEFPSEFVIDVWKAIGSAKGAAFL